MGQVLVCDFAEGKVKIRRRAKRKTHPSPR